MWPLRVALDALTRLRGTRKVKGVQGSAPLLSHNQLYHILVPRSDRKLRLSCTDDLSRLIFHSRFI